MKEATILHEISPEQIIELFNGLQKQLNEFKESFVPKTPEEYMSRKEVATMLKCDESTVSNWVNAGKIQSYGLSGRVWYKRSEIESAIIPLKKRI